MATINIHGGAFTFTVSGVSVTPTVGAIYYISSSLYNFYITATNITAGSGTVTGVYSGYQSSVIASSGTLVKTSGTGDTNISFSSRTCPSTVHLRDVRYATGDTLTIVNTENNFVDLICDASDATTSVVNGGTYTDAQTIETVLIGAVTNTSTNSNFQILNPTSTLMPVMFSAAGSANRFLSNGATAKNTITGAWLSIGTGTGATGQTIQMNTVASVTGKYIDNPPMVQVEYVAGSGALVTTAPSTSDTYTNNGVTFTVVSTSITSGKGEIRATGASDPTLDGLLTRTAGSGDAVIGMRSFYYDNVTSQYVLQVGEAYKTYLNIGGAYNNSANTPYVHYKQFSGFGTAQENGSYFEYDEYNGGVGYGKLIFATASGGYPPPSGANIRIPNIHFSANAVAQVSTGSRIYMGASYLGQGRYDLSVCSFSDRFYWGAGTYLNNSNFYEVGVSAYFAVFFSTGDLTFNGLYQCIDKWVANAGYIAFSAIVGTVSFNNIYGMSGTSSAYPVLFSGLDNVITSCSNIYGMSVDRAQTYRKGVQFAGVKAPSTAPLVIYNVRNTGNSLSFISGCENLIVIGHYHSDQASGVASTSVGVGAIDIDSSKNCVVHKTRLLPGGVPCYSNFINSPGNLGNSNCSVNDVIYDGAGVAGADHTSDMGYLTGSRAWIANVTINNMRTAMIGYNVNGVAPSRISNARTDTVGIGTTTSAHPGQTQLEMISGTSAVTGYSTVPDNPPFQTIIKSSTLGTLGMIWGSLYTNKFAFRTTTAGTEGLDFYISGARDLDLPNSGVGLVYATNVPVKGLKNSATTFSGATLTAAGSSPTSGVTYKFRMAKWGTAVSGGYTEMTAANLQTAFDSIRDATISTVGINLDIEITTTTALSTRYLRSYDVTDIEIDNSFVQTEVGFIQVGYTNPTSGTSIGLYNNKVPATPVEVEYTASTSAADLVEFPYDFNGVTAKFLFIARKAGYGEKRVDSECYQAGITVPVGQTAQFACTDAAVANITINGATKTITFDTADKSGQDLYQTAQYWSHQQANMLYDVPVTSLLGTTYTLADDWDLTPASGFHIADGKYIALGGTGVLTEAFGAGSSYTYTNGTWIANAGVPTFSGGTLAIGAAGTYVFTQASSMLVRMTPTAPSTYNLSGCTFTGTLTVNNMAAHAITVQVPAGTTTSTAGNTGGVITFSAPVSYQSVTVTNITTTSRVQIYDTTNSVELYNAIPGATSITWTNSTAAPTYGTFTPRVRITDVVGATAKKFIESTLSDCGILSTDKDQSYRASQTNDTTYNSNAINGPAIYATSGITFTDAATDLVNCNISGGTVAWKTVYACFVHWMNTAVGITDDIAYIYAPDTANYLLTSMKIKNTSSPTAPLTITGGYGRDYSTGAVADIIDTTGGMVFPAPDHVVPYQTTGTYAITGDIADIPAKVQTGMTSQGYTTTRATNMDKALTTGKFLGLK